MFCPKCGQQNENAALFCIFCGQKIQAAANPDSRDQSILPTEALVPRAPSVMNEPAQSTEIGHVLNGRYRISKELGTGGMGKVLLAFDEKMEFDVVIKEMLPYMLPPKERKYIEDHFKEEAKMLYRLKHLGLPRVMDFFDNGPIIYIVMEYIEGEDLDSLVKKRPNHRIEIQEFFNWTSEALKILKYLHNQDPPIIHRDIKPGNIMITRNNELVLVDFGVARTIAAHNNTQTKVGTPGFASPEHFFGKFILASDIYSLGATFHYLLTGDDPGAGILLISHLLSITGKIFPTDFRISWISCWTRNRNYGMDKLMKSRRSSQDFP
jgi:eukaryotic-like serine/threonine-protein kinase